MSYQDELNKLMEQFKHACFGYAQNQDEHTSRRMAEAKQAVEQLVTKLIRASAAPVASTVPAPSTTQPEPLHYTDGPSFMLGWDQAEKIMAAKVAKALDVKLMREDFEDYSISIGRNQLERRNEGYKYGLTNEAWMAWTACSVRKVMCAVLEKVRSEQQAPTEGK